MGPGLQAESVSTTHPYAAVARQERQIAALSASTRGIPGPRLGPVLPPLPVLATPSLQRVHGGGRLDSSYRLKDAVLWNALGWTAGTRVRVRAREGGFYAELHDLGTALSGRTARLTVPEPVWRLLGLMPGMHLLLIADKAANCLLGVTPSHLDTLVVTHDRA